MHIVTKITIKATVISLCPHILHFPSVTDLLLAFVMFFLFSTLALVQPIQGFKFKFKFIGFISSNIVCGNKKLAMLRYDCSLFLVRVVTRDMGSGITGPGSGIVALPWDQGSQDWYQGL